MTISLADIQRLDQRWDSTKIRTLIHGEATVTITDATGRQYDEQRAGRSAYDLRCSALDNGRIEDILEPLQLDLAIAAIADQNLHAAIAMHATTRGKNLAEIADAMGVDEGRVGRYLERGIELVRRHEGGRAVERSGSRVGSAVCWKCLERPAVPGELCEEGCDGKTDRERRQLAGLLRGPAVPPYDPTEVADPAMMTQEEIDAEIAHLAATAGVSDEDAWGVDRRKRDAPIAGGAEYAKQVFPYGSSPSVIKEDWSPIA